MNIKTLQLFFESTKVYIAYSSYFNNLMTNEKLTPKLEVKGPHTVRSFIEAIKSLIRVELVPLYKKLGMKNYNQAAYSPEEIQKDSLEVEIEALDGILNTAIRHGFDKADI